jgi:anti-sigma factor RsiW
MEDKQQKDECVFWSEHHLVDLLPSYINGHVEQREQTRIEDHLAQCRQCQEDLQLLLDLKAVGSEIFGDE